MTRTARQRIKQIEREGLTITKLVYGKHLKFHVVAPDGRTMILTTSQTPSDCRAGANIRSLLKRFAQKPF